MTTLEHYITGIEKYTRPVDAEAVAARQQARNDARESPGEDRSSAEFFSENLSSLLDTSSAVTRIEIRRSSTANRLHEELAFTLK